VIDFGPTMTRLVRCRTGGGGSSSGIDTSHRRSIAFGGGEQRVVTAHRIEDQALVSLGTSPIQPDRASAIAGSTLSSACPPGDLPRIEWLRRATMAWPWLRDKHAWRLPSRGPGGIPTARALNKQDLTIEEAVESDVDEGHEHPLPRPTL